jgi:HEAT repeat protein
LAKLGDMRVVQQLIPLLSNSEKDIRDAAVVAIAQLSGSISGTGDVKKLIIDAWDWWAKIGRAEYQGKVEAG